MFYKDGYTMSAEMQKLYVIYQLDQEQGEETFDGAFRKIAANELLRMIRLTRFEMPEHGILNDQFEFDGLMHITCGSKGQWDIVIWSDGIIQPCTDDSGIYEGDPINIFDVLKNPELLEASLKALIDDFCDQNECGFDDLIQDRYGGWSWNK